MKIKNLTKFALGIFDLIGGVGLIVICLAKQREQRMIYNIFPILCGIFSLLDSIETKKQQQERKEEPKKFFEEDKE